MYYHKALHCMPLVPLQLESLLDISICRLGMTGHQPVTIVYVYIPPVSGQEDHSWEKVSKMLKEEEFTWTPFPIT